MRNNPRTKSRVVRFLAAIPWLEIAIEVYLLGMLVFYTMATFDKESWQGRAWVTAYYLWSKSLDLLLGAAILSRPAQLKIFKPVFYLIVARWMWDIICLITGWNINNKQGIGVLFILFTLVSLLIFIKQWRKQS